MTRREFAAHNVVATFPDRDDALRAVESLHEAGVDARDISFLSRKDTEAVSQAETREQTEELLEKATKEVATKSAAGAALGGGAGLLAGALAFAIPGVGPGIGVGIWATALGGAAAGATAGGVSGGIASFWDERYRDAVKEGAVLVGVHADDRSTVDTAADWLRKANAAQLDLFDEKGERVATSEGK